jgi:hypothetical protein
VALDLDRLKLEASRVSGAVSGGFSGPPRTPKGGSTPCSRRGGNGSGWAGPQSTPGGKWGSPISLTVPATPATAQMLRDMGIRVQVEGSSNAFLSPPGPSP